VVYDAMPLSGQIVLLDINALKPPAISYSRFPDFCCARGCVGLS
jgi:hypothetical protein